MKPEKKPSDMDGLFWKILAVVGTAASIASLVLTIYDKMANKTKLGRAPDTIPALFYKSNTICTEGQYNDKKNKEVHRCLLGNIGLMRGDYHHHKCHLKREEPGAVTVKEPAAPKWA